MQKTYHIECRDSKLYSFQDIMIIYHRWYQTVINQVNNKGLIIPVNLYRTCTNDMTCLNNKYANRVI